MAVLFLMMGIVFFLRCFLGWLGILLIVTPIFILDIVMWAPWAFFGTEVG